MKIVSAFPFTHPHIVPNLCEILFVEHNRRYFEKSISVFDQFNEFLLKKILFL